MSEKRDLWVPALLALAGIGLLVCNLIAEQGSLLAGIGALIVGLVGAIACLPIRIRKGQKRVMVFGLGVAILLFAFRPGAEATPPAIAAYLLAAAGFLFPLPAASLKTRKVMLGAAGLLALFMALALLDAVPQELVWMFAAGALFMALQVFHTREVEEPEPPPGPRICVFGGTFDPFHRGHRTLVETALKANDRVLVVVAGSAPHKFVGEEGAVPDRTPFHHRVAMTRLGVEGLPRTEVLEMEGKRSGPSYTVDTLETLTGSFAPGTRFRLLVGADMLQDFPNWREWRRILGMATLQVAARPGWSSRSRLR